MDWWSFCRPPSSFFSLNGFLALIQDNVGPLAAKLLPGIDNPYLGTALASLAILGVCFAVGIMVRTQIGKWLHTGLEQILMKRIPGYMLIKETVSQFLGAKKTPFSTVALVRLFDNDTLVTCFVTDEYPGRLYGLYAHRSQSDLRQYLPRQIRAGGDH